MPETKELRSAIFKGYVWHQRFQPTAHQFRYRVFMMYLDLAEQHEVFSKSLLWGTNWYHAARFKRSDYFSINGDNSQSIESAVRQEVKSQTGIEVSGPVCLLTNLRYFGYNTNPISCYYCYDSDAEGLVALLIEVTNTPWGEKHHYVLDLRSHKDNESVEFQKRMHVSPFMPMNRIYRWRGSVPSTTLRYSLASVVADDSVSNDASSGAELYESDRYETEGEIQFDSGVVFKRQPVTSRALNTTLAIYPLMTLKVITAIYWQALRLWMKRVPFVAHPAKSATSLKIQS